MSVKESLLEAASQLAKKQDKPKIPDFLDGTFPEQKSFILDTSPFQYVFCTRRAAKSYSAGLKAIHVAFKHKRCQIPIISLTRAEVKRVFWDAILKEVDEKYALGIRFNETDLTATLPNGSVLYLIGLDSNEKEKRKVLGSKMPLAIIDEAQEFRTDLSELVYHVLKPATTDYRGSICLLGTPGTLSSGLFFDVTTGKETGWKVHEWTTFQNPYNAKNWAAEIAELQVMKPGIELTPFFRRNYLREWVIEDDALIYRYAARRNDFLELPIHPQGSWHRVLGIDLGYNDPSAFVVAAWHDHDPTLFFEAAFKQAKMDITDVAEKIRWFSSRYDLEHLIIDGANKQAVEEMRRRHDLALIPADKTGKADFIELMNSDLLIGRVKLNPLTCSDLMGEYASLIWDPKSAKRQEHPACENHATDAALYAWRFCFNYLSQAEPKKPKPGSAEWMQAQMKEMEAAALARLDQKRGAEEGSGDPENWEVGWEQWK